MTGHLCEPGYVQGFSAIINLLKSEDLNRIEGRDYALTQKRDKIFNDLIGHYETVIGGNKEKRYA